MAVDILLDEEGDIALVNNSLVLTSNMEESSRQQVLITLRTYKGEWIGDINFGIPYLKNKNNPIQLLGKDGNKHLIDSYIKEAILTRENITDILSYESTVDVIERTMKVTFTAKTNSGSVISIEADVI